MTIAPMALDGKENQLEANQIYNSLVTSLLASYADVNNYTSFAAAVTSIASTEKTLIIAESKTVATDVTVPATLTLQFRRGGELNISSGKTVTMNGPIEAGSFQIIAGSGTISLGTGVDFNIHWITNSARVSFQTANYNCKRCQFLWHTTYGFLIL